VRRGIGRVPAGRPPHADLEIRADSKTWIEVVIGLRSLPAAMATGAVEVEGGFTKVRGAAIPVDVSVISFLVARVK